MRRILISIAIAVPIVLILIVAGVYVYDEVLHPDRVGRNITAAEVDISGLSTEEAVAAVADYEALLIAAPAPFIVDGQKVVLDPVAVGFAVDEQAVVNDALDQRRSGGFLSDVGGWFSSWRSPVVIAIPITIDEEMAEEVLFVLHPAASVAGVVRDPSGRPVSGAEVTIELDLAGRMEAGARGDVPSTKTDSEGEFLLEGMDPGSIALVASHAGFAASEATPVELIEGTQLDGIVMVLRQGGLLTGVVLGKDGEAETEDDIVNWRVAQDGEEAGEGAAPDDTFEGG